MSQTYDDNDIFALVVDGNIVEYPVHYSSIINRAHPVDMYTKVYFENSPVTSPFHYVPEKLELLEDGRVVLKYGVPEPISLEMLLQRARGPILLQSMSKIVEVPKALADRIFTLVEENVEKTLDDFVNLKGYKDVVTAISYIGSTTPEFNDDGIFCRDLRDSVWNTYFLYKNDILAGKVPYPESWLEMISHLPSMVWPNTSYTQITQDDIVPVPTEQLIIEPVE